ncbi:MAG: DUF2510 domain-containing protein [Pseudolysinimonas sp.]
MTDLQQDAPSAPAGWYPDPVRPGSNRYWSGTGWTDQVTSPIAEQIPGPAYTPLGVMFDAGPVVEEPPAGFAAPSALRGESHATQSEWHQTRARPIQRVGVAPVSTTARLDSSTSARQNDPYDRNWIAGLAIVFAVLSIPAIGVRVLMDLPALTQSIVAGAPIGISLLAFARAARHRSGLVLSLIALVISVVTLLIAWLVDPAVIQDVADMVLGLLPA